MNRTPSPFEPRHLACRLAFAACCATAPCLGGSEAPPQAKALTLQAALELALQRNPAADAASARVDAATGRALQAGKWANPELILSAEEWPVDGDGDFSDAKQTVGLAQTIPFFGKKRLDRRIGVSGVRTSERERSLHRRELIRNVKVAFYQVLAAEGVVEVANGLVELAEFSVAATGKRVAAGAATAQEELRAEISLEQAKTELADCRDDLASARHALAQWLGLPELARVPVQGRLAESVDLASLQRQPGLWLEQHPGVAAAREEVERAELEARRARLEALPDVRMQVAGGQEGGTGVHVLELDFGVPLPLLDRGRGRNLEAAAQVRAAQAGQAAVEQQLLREWGAATHRLRTAAEQVATYRDRILPKASEALALVQTGFEQGKFGVAELLDSQRTASEARLTYQRKLLALNTAQAELEALQADEPSSASPPPSGRSAK